MGVSGLSCCRRIRGQFDRLSRELNEVAAVAINKKKPLRVSPSHQTTERQWTTPLPSPQHSRSLPAIGIKPMAKKRPSLFNIVDHAAVDENGETPLEEDGYQLCADASHVPGLAVAKGIEVRERVGVRENVEVRVSESGGEGDPEGVRERVGVRAGSGQGH